MIQKIVYFIFEALHLKQIKHEWVRLAWVSHPDSVAEHSLNAAQIWYLLAHMEWADANKVAAMLVRHDIAETRIWDIHRVWCRYIRNKKEIEENVMNEQLGEIPWWPDIQHLFDEYEQRSTLEWKIAKDADYLEQAFQAKIYVEQWYASCQEWIESVWVALKTESAKTLRKDMTNTLSTDRRSKTWLKEFPKE